jgi:hypothetical protein
MAHWQDRFLGIGQLPPELSIFEIEFFQADQYRCRTRPSRSTAFLRAEDTKSNFKHDNRFWRPIISPQKAGGC